MSHFFGTHRPSSLLPTISTAWVVVSILIVLLLLSLIVVGAHHLRNPHLMYNGRWVSHSEMTGRQNTLHCTLHQSPGVIGRTLARVGMPFGLTICFDSLDELQTWVGSR